MIGFPVRKLGGKAVELPTKVLLRSGADTELGTFWITGSAAKGTDAERWLDSWNLVLQSAERLFGVPQSATRTLEIVDSARVAITLATPWCWRTFAELLAAAEKRMRHLEVDISGPAPNVVSTLTQFDRKLTEDHLAVFRRSSRPVPGCTLAPASSRSSR